LGDPQAGFPETAANPTPGFVALSIMPAVAARRPHLPPGASRRAVPRWIRLLAALGAVAVTAVIFGGAYWDTYQIRREAARLERERDELRRQNAQLREEIRLLNTPEYVERIAREQLGLVKPGEVAVILVAPSPGPARPDRPSAGGGPGAERRAPDERLPQPGRDAWWTRLWRGIAR
jgi:cell division protein FtsL